MRYSGLRSRIPPSAPIIGLAVVIAALAIGLIIGGSLRFVFFLLLLGVLIYVLPRPGLAGAAAAPAGERPARHAAGGP